MAALQYSTGIAALAGYALCSVRRNGLLRIATTCAAVFACIAAWPRFLNALSGLAIDYGATERAYVQAALEKWISLLSDPPQLLSVYARKVANHMSYEMPLITAVGVAGLVLLVTAYRRMDLAVYIAALFVFPILALAAYSGGSATGYITYQTAIFVYVGVGYLLWRIAESRALGPAAATALGIALVACQLVWNLSYLVGAAGPSQIFFSGLDCLWAWVPRFTHVPEVASLTGLDPTPALFRGSATVADAGLASSVVENVTQPSVAGTLSRALILRAPFVLLFLLTAFLLFRMRSFSGAGASKVRVGSAWAAGLGVAFVLLAGPAWLNLRTRADSFPAFGDFMSRFKGSTLRYEIDISPDFLGRLESLPDDVRELEVVQGFRFARRDNPDARVMLIGAGLRVELGAALTHTVARDGLIRALRASPRLALEAANLADSAVQGWQKNGLPGRRLSVGDRVLSPEEQTILPLFEIRAREPGGVRLLLLAGF